MPSLVDGVAAERPGAGGSARPRVPAGLALSLPLTAWLIAGFALPLAIVLLLSVQAETDMFAPVSLVPSATQYVELITDGFMVGVFVRTLLLAAAVTAASAVLAYPLALWLVRLPPKWRAAGMTLVLVPLLTNVVVRSLGLMLVLAPAGPIGEIAALFGLPRPNLLFGWFAVWLALTQVFMPFMVMALYDALDGLDRRQEEAAAILGAGPVTRFFRVTLPATLPGLRSGIVVVFLMVSTAYVSATLLGGRRVQTNGMIVFQEALQLLNQPKAAALAMLMLVASIVVSALVGLVIGRMTPWLSGRPARARAGASPRLSRALTRLIEGAGPLVAVTLRWLALALLLFPLVLVVVSSFNDSPQATSAQFVGFTLKWYALVFDNIRYMDAFWLSLWLALATVAVSLVLTIPAAFALARHPFPGRDALAAWFMLPLALPNIAIGLGMLRLLQWFIEIEPFLGLLAVHVVLVAPFMLAMLRASVIAIDRGQEEAAASLGAKPLAVFLRASLPQIVPGITSAAIIGFLVSFGEVTVTAFLTSPRLQTLPVRIYAEATFSLENTVNAVSTMIIVVTVILLLVVDRFVKLDRVWKR